MYSYLGGEQMKSCIFKGKTQSHKGFELESPNPFATRIIITLSTSPEGITAMGNANNIVEDLNSSCQTHFLRDNQYITSVWECCIYLILGCYELESLMFSDWEIFIILSEKELWKIGREKKKTETVKEEK